MKRERRNAGWGKGHGELDTELVMGMLLQKGVRSLETYTLEMD